jgi:hypothetical protein
VVFLLAVRPRQERAGHAVPPPVFAIERDPATVIEASGGLVCHATADKTMNATEKAATVIQHR